MTNYFLYPSDSKIYEKTLFIMKPRYSEKNFASPLAIRYNYEGSTGLPIGFGTRGGGGGSSPVFWLVVGLADFHFHISWKLNAWLVRTDLTNTLSS